jgi:hypothetical protein
VLDRAAVEAERLRRRVADLAALEAHAARLLPEVALSLRPARLEAGPADEADGEVGDGAAPGVAADQHVARGPAVEGEDLAGLHHPLALARVHVE